MPRSIRPWRWRRPTSPTLPAGLRPGERYRCGGCGNLTRFDVLSRERVRRFWHLDLSGTGAAEEVEELQVTVESVTCRWCGSSDAIAVVEALAVDQAAERAPHGRGSSPELGVSE